MTQIQNWIFFIEDHEGYIKVVSEKVCTKPNRTAIWKNLQTKISNPEVYRVGYASQEEFDTYYADRTVRNIYVRLNRQLGATNKRITEKGSWLMLIPVRNADGTYSAPSNIRFSPYSATYSKYLKEGEVVLVNPVSGGWNTLLKSDKILEMYEK